MEISRLFDFIYYQKEQLPLERSFGYRKNGQWVYFSTDEMIDRVNQVSRGLLELGVQPGDKIGLVTYQNRPEWVIMDLGMQQVGAVNVPVYPTISPREYEYIFNDAEVKYCFCGSGDLVGKVRKAKEQVPSLQGIYAFDEESDAPFWETMFRADGQEEVEKRKKAIKTEDLATIIYTSGTTGDPKGVMLSHHNVVSNIIDVQEIMPLDPGDRVLSFLPLCHIFERAASYAYMYNSFSVTFTGTDNLGGPDGDLAAVKPHFFTTVPRLLEKVYEKIYNKGLDLTGVKKRLFFWALKLTDDYEFDKEYSGWAKIKRNIADKLIFGKWREALGGEIKGILTGAAPCPLKMARVFSAAGIPIREGYGLTEASPGLALGRYSPQGAMLGAVGPALRRVEIEIEEDDNYGPGEGEVLAAGPNIMMGYYKKPAETEEVIFEKDGKRWLRTGDIGTLVDGPGGLQYLKITDRKKELLKTSGGKYVAPAVVENKLKEDFLIEQVMVVGESKKFVSALIIPAEEALRDWCDHKEIPYTTRGEMIKHPQVLDKFQRIIDAYNPNFSHIEQVKKFVLLDTNWEPTKEDGSKAELTPTMKLKRRVIRDKHAAEIDGIYIQ